MAGGQDDVCQATLLRKKRMLQTLTLNNTAGLQHFFTNNIFTQFNFQLAFGMKW